VRKRSMRWHANAKRPYPRRSQERTRCPRISWYLGSAVKIVIVLGCSIDRPIRVRWKLFEQLYQLNKRATGVCGGMRFRNGNLQHVSNWQVNGFFGHKYATIKPSFYGMHGHLLSTHYSKIL